MASERKEALCQCEQFCFGDEVGEYHFQLDHRWLFSLKVHPDILYLVNPPPIHEFCYPQQMAESPRSSLTQMQFLYSLCFIFEDQDSCWHPSHPCVFKSAGYHGCSFLDPAYAAKMLTVHQDGLAARNLCGSDAD